ncbi:UDP-GlcNAc:betaGal beta-1 [Tropilaelaps mercedesae]|uniref:Hexosyltransferase n=1 Tax=Tropilaelaps mercedesae TaxID=418985 RepID=A0A1V9X370_9ACAR|nr:UDP-GlcNAc:betaGal beta-1 [Tropilaelaps mercedesae]
MCLRRGPFGLVTLVAGFLVTAWLILAITVDDSSINPPFGVVFDAKTPKTAKARRSEGPATVQILVEAAREDLTVKAIEKPPPVGDDSPAGVSDQIRLTDEVGWVIQRPENFTVHRGFEANAHNYTYILNAETLCNDLDPRRLRVLVFVETHVKNTERRKAIRKTWAQRALQKALNYRVVFLFGNGGNETVQQAALLEHYFYGDVAQEDFPERFENLSIKSVMGLKYAVTFCRSTDYVVKVDDDIYLHMPNVLKSFERHRRSPLKDNLICHRNRVKHILRPGKSLEVLRPKTMKYEVRDDVIPGSSFPPYCSGFSYGMSLRVARKLYEASLGTPLFFIEDVYVTGFCRHKAGVSLTDHPGMTLAPEVTQHNAPCYFHFAERINSNEIGPQEMLDIWDAVNTAGFFCPK